MTNPDEALDIIKRALNDCAGGDGDPEWYADNANTILDALAAKGLVIRPREPTEEMVEVGILQAQECNDAMAEGSPVAACTAEHVWCAMIAAGEAGSNG